jgi:hypothetical protein
MRRSTIRVTTIDLGYEQLLLLEAAAGTRVRVLYGAMWLTEEGMDGDAVVRGGNDALLRSGGRTLIEALSPGRVQLIEHTPASGLAGSLRAALRALARGIRGLRVRSQLGPAADCGTCA